MILDGLHLAIGFDPGVAEAYGSLAEELLAANMPRAAQLVTGGVLGLTLEQVAAEVGLSVSGVRKRLRSMRHILGEMTT